MANGDTSRNKRRSIDHQWHDTLVSAPVMVVRLLDHPLACRHGRDGAGGQAAVQDALAVGACAVDRHGATQHVVGELAGLDQPDLGTLVGCGRSRVPGAIW